MKKLYKPLGLISVLALFCLSAQAGPGDTISVKTHDKVHMGWNGSYDGWGVFPKDTAKIAKVVLYYTMACPTSGCSDWDYTNRIYLRHRPGYKDSTLLQAPSFRVDGQVKDSIRFTTTQVYSYLYDTISMMVTDSTPLASQKLMIYGDTTKPLLATDSMDIWMEGYTYVLNGAGKKVDSVFIAATQVMKVDYTGYYNVFDKIIDYELARAITPYGGLLANTWSYTYKLDVTDFISLLHDSVQIRSFYDGWSDGFSVTLDFRFIYGTPARKPYKIVQLWQGYFPYGNDSDPIENYLDQRSVPIDANAKGVKLRILQTGHGFGGNENCAEFCPKYNYVKVNGNVQYSNYIWKDDCGSNPIWPQAGTWVYDRANWCPGLEVKVFENELTPFVTAGSNASIDVDMDAFSNQGNSFCGYNFSGQVVFYDDYVYNNDAGLEEIVAPSNELNYNRFNPICNSPVVKVKNHGKNAITSVRFQYGVMGGSDHFITWSGNIKPGESQQVSLASVNWSAAASGSFSVKITEVNGGPDDNALNNRQVSTFSLPPVYPNEVIIYIKTNNAGNENSYVLKDQAGNIIRQRSGMSNNTIYRDTVKLNNGCYRFEFIDTDGDGLNFFANSDGTGLLRLLRTNNTLLKNFNPEFGNEVVHEFTAGFALSAPEEKEQVLIPVYPNPAQEEATVDLSLLSGFEKQLCLRDVTGRELLKTSVNAGNDLYKIDLSGFGNGLYFLSVSANGNNYVTKVVVGK